MLEMLLENIDLGSIIMGVLTAILGWLGATIKKLYNDKVKNETIRNVIDDCVKYVEQKSKTETIQNKYEMAKDKAVNKAFETGEGLLDGNTSTEWKSLVATKTNWTISLL